MDSTADSTAVIIVVDATSWDYIAPDSTGVSPVQAATANTLINDFSDSSEPMLTQSTAIFDQLEGIKNLISGYSPSDYTPTALLDTLTQQSLDASFSSAAWLTASDNIQNVQAIKQDCDVLNKVGKYVDTGSMIDSMKGGVLKDAMDAISGVTDQFKVDFPSLSLPEFEIGKQLSDLANTGRSLYEDVATSFSEAVSDVIEHGKGGLAKATAAIAKEGAAVGGAIMAAESGIASLAEPMKILDGMINCVDAVGGGPFASQTDQMIDRADDIYGKLGVESDPNSPNFGEFDETVFLDSIGGLTPEQKSGLKKGLNTYNKASNNAVGIVEKAKDSATTAKEWEKSTSSLSSGGKDESPAKKSSYVTDNVKVEVEVPAVPGGAKATTVEPTPTPVAPPPVIASAPAPTAGTPYKDLIKSYDVFLEQLPYSNYLFFDPNEKGFEQYKADMTKLVPEGKTENPDDLEAELTIGNVSYRVGSQSIIGLFPDKRHEINVAPVTFKIWRRSIGKNVAISMGTFWMTDWISGSKFEDASDELLLNGTIQCIRSFPSLTKEVGFILTPANMEALLTYTP